jgi:hypothetical protein
MIEGFGHWKMQEEARRRREELDETSLERIVKHNDLANIDVEDDKDAKKIGMANPDMRRRRLAGIKLGKKQYKRKTGKTLEW